MARKNKDPNALSVFRTLQVVFQTLHRYVPGFAGTMLVFSAFGGLVNALVSVLGVKLIFDALAANAGFGQTARLIVILLVTAGVLRVVRQRVYVIYYEKKQLELHRRMQGELFEAALRQDLGAYDDPKFYNDFVWAMQEADTRFLGVLGEVANFIDNTARLITALGVMLSIHWGFLPIIAVGVILSLLIRSKQIKIRHQVNNLEKPFWRQREYAARAFYLPEYAKELRLSKVGQALEQDLGNSIDGQKSAYYRLRHHLAFARIADVMVSQFWILAASNILMIYHMTVTGLITAGGFAAAQNGVWQVYWGITSFLYAFTNMGEHGLYVQKYLDFLKRKPALTVGTRSMPSEFESLEIKDLSFSYPGSEEKVLDGVNLTVRAGEKIAFVGYNGAGKSTLIKLILRLYDPSEGQILLNGVDIREYELEPYRRFFGALFQDFTLFAATVAENVLAAENDPARRDEILHALEEADFTQRLATMPAGLDTPLTREFYENGENLSGGELQKLGIARVLASRGKLWVLDEPSSALDPDSEAQFNRNLMHHGDGKTILFISHRLSTTRMSDRIYMLAGGKLLEYGSHNELMANNGAYAEMFNLQAEKYRRGQSNA